MCGVVVGVYLYGELFVCVDELDEQREYVAEPVVVLFSHELSLQLGY